MAPRLPNDTGTEEKLRIRDPDILRVSSSMASLTAMVYNVTRVNTVKSDVSDVETGLEQRALVVIDRDVESSSNVQKGSSATTRLQAGKLCLGAAGIYAAYLCYGHFQEDIFKFRAEDGRSFTFVWFLTLMECVANIMVGYAGRRVFGGRDDVSIAPFLQSGVANVFAKAFTSLSLAAGLSFPICILTKSAKIVPVMLGQLIIGGSTYNWRDYSVAALIVTGTAMLSIGEKGDKLSGPNTTVAGLLFIMASLVMDGVTGGLQKRLKQDMASKPPTTYDFLYFTNLAMAAVAFAISMCTNDFVRGMNFLSEHPVLAKLILKVCLCSAVGQSFIFFIVAHFDPLVCSTITTTRKILSVLWSITMKGNNLTSNSGAFGLGLAVLGLILEVQGKVPRRGNANGREPKSG